MSPRAIMAKFKELPGFRAKRKVLFGEKVPAERRLEMGREFMDAERYDDALEFFARSGAKDEVLKIAQRAIEAGDTALLLRAKVVLKEAPTDEELTRVAQAAEKAGLTSQAYLAHLKAGHAEEAERLRMLLPGAKPPEAALAGTDAVDSAGGAADKNEEAT